MERRISLYISGLPGRTRALSPLRQPARLEAGIYSLEVSLPGHYPVTRSVALAGGQLARETVTLPPRTALPVYRRQLFPERVFGEEAATPERAGETLFENEGVRLWRLPELDAGIGIVSFKSRMHAIGEEVMDGLLAAVAQAERDLDGLVLWHPAPFAVGADLNQVGRAANEQDFERLEAMVDKFQRCARALKYAQVPTVAAVQGMALGGGCELALHASRRVLALETQVGLVEAGVGLIPAGGGCKAFALRAAELARNSATPTEVMPFLQDAFMTIAMAKVSGSALEARERGFAREADPDYQGWNTGP